MAQNLKLGFRVNESPETLLKELVLSPLIYVRFLGLICSIVVFGCISDKVQVSGGCGYNYSNACSFGVAVGVIAFLLCLAFLVRDVIYVVIDFRNNVMAKKVVLIVDAVANGLWTFMWFIAFVYLADQWRKTTTKGANRNCGNSGVAFSFICMFIWAAIVGINVFFFVRLMKEGGGEGGGRKGGGYASFPEGGSTDDGSDREGGGQNYQPPEY